MVPYHRTRYVEHPKGIQKDKHGNFVLGAKPSLRDHTAVDRNHIGRYEIVFHGYQRHIGKSFAYLKQRFNEERVGDRATSFVNEQKANYFIGKMLRDPAHGSELERVFGNSGTTTAITSCFQESTGYGISSKKTSA